MPVNLNHSDGLTGINLAIAYDTSRLTVSAADIQRGSLTGAFDSFTVSVDAAAGIIRIEGYHTAGPLDGLGSGSVALIDFHVKENAPAGAAFINLLQNAGPTWTSAAGMDGQGNEFLFDLEPRPSNAAGNVLDGSISVMVPAVPSVQATGGAFQGSEVTSVAGDSVTKALVDMPVNQVAGDHIPDLSGRRQRQGTAVSGGRSRR